MGWRFLGRGRLIGLILGILGRLGSFMGGITEIANRSQEITTSTIKTHHSYTSHLLCLPTPNIANPNPKTNQ